MECVDLKGFEEFVMARGLVKETHLSFYVHWVRHFLQAEFSHSEWHVFLINWRAMHRSRIASPFSRCFHFESLASRGSCGRLFRRYGLQRLSRENRVECQDSREEPFLYANFQISLLPRRVPPRPPFTTLW